MSRPRRIPGLAVLLAFALGAGLPVLPGPAGAQEACSTYVVKRGDSLRRITRRALRHDRFLELYEANRPVLASPNAIEVGQVLRIPCADGSLPPGIDDAALRALQPPPEGEVPVPAAPVATGPEPVSPAAPAPHGFAEIRFVSAGGPAPLAADVPGGGIVAELLARIMETAAPGQPFRIDTVRDPRAQVETLLPLGAFDIGFPWLRPDCAAPDRLPPPARRLCAGYRFSAPLLDLETAVLVRDGDPLARAVDAAALAGARVCRAAGTLAPEPHAAGLLPEDAVLSDAPLAACAAAVREGRAEAVLADPGLLGGAVPAGLVAAPGLAARRAVVAIALATNTEAVARLDFLDARIAEIAAGPEWAALVAGEIARWRKAQGG